MFSPHPAPPLASTPTLSTITRSLYKSPVLPTLVKTPVLDTSSTGTSSDLDSVQATEPSVGLDPRPEKCHHKCTWSSAHTADENSCAECGKKYSDKEFKKWRGCFPEKRGAQNLTHCKSWFCSSSCFNK